MGILEKQAWLDKIENDPQYPKECRELAIHLINKFEHLLSEVLGALETSSNRARKEN